MRLLVPGLFIATLAAARPALADNFSASCDTDSIVIAGTIVTATCKTLVGGKRCSKLDLNQCLKNTYGAIQDDPDGKG